MKKRLKMNMVKLLGIAIIVMVIGFSMFSCNVGNNSCEHGAGGQIYPFHQPVLQRELE
jgi:hypothetical protein